MERDMNEEIKKMETRTVRVWEENEETGEVIFDDIDVSDTTTHPRISEYPEYFQHNNEDGFDTMLIEDELPCSYRKSKDYNPEIQHVKGNPKTIQGLNNAIRDILNEIDDFVEWCIENPEED